MALTTRIKSGMNSVLSRANLQIETLTAHSRERQRLERLNESGYFDRPVFPVPAAFAASDPLPIFAALARYEARFADFESPARNDVGFCFDNGFFGSPDAEVLYAVVREFQPETILEIGSGHSTRVSRQAILDGGLATKLACIDPHPRVEVARVADEVFERPVETMVGDPLLGRLRAGDVLFIDSSHELLPGNDCVALYLRVLPRLPAGVVVHIHDVFLPCEYPRSWVLDERRDWNEQYLVQAILQFGDAFEVLWAGHYLQQTNPQFAAQLPRARTKPATSLWLRKK